MSQPLEPVDPAEQPARARHVPVDVSICVFAKPPLAGQVNTRLAPAVGVDGAARLAKAFLRDTLALTRSCRWARTVLATTGPMTGHLPDAERVEEWPQGTGDLGDRLQRVLARALEMTPAVLALGVDSPGLPLHLLTYARHALRGSDAVVGPTADGGFYTLGLTRIVDGLFEGLTWSAPTTCRDTVQRLRDHGYTPAMLPPWFDVDVPADLARLAREISDGSIDAPATALALASLEID